MDNSNIKAKLDDLKSGKLTCEANLNNFLQIIEEKNKDLNIFLQINDTAKDIAKQLDKKRENKGKLGSLFGLCIAIKSNISFKDMFISCASKTLENYKGTFNADVMEYLLKEDAIIIGVVNNDEFASGGSGETSAFGNTDNPFSLGRIPGGSSSGSAAAIAANMCDITLGSDTGGSIRNPASHCNIIGIKPSYGRVSRYGLVDLSMSLDQIGPLTNDLYAAALVLQVISVYSENDPVMVDKSIDKYTDFNTDKKFKIGIIKEFEDLISDKRIREIYHNKIKSLKDAGHEIIELNLKHIDLSIQAYYPIVYTEFFSGTRKFDSVKYGKHIEDSAGSEALRRVFGGREISRSEFDGAYYKKALKVKEIIAKEFEKAFEKVDFIISPVTPTLPHKFEETLTPEQMYAYDAFTIPANLGGICAGVISKDTVEIENEKISVGTQVFANKFQEKTLFEALNLIDEL